MRLNLNELAKTVFGRAVYDENGALALAWAMSGFAVRVRASHIVLHFSPDYSHDQPAYVKVTLDGVSSKHAISTGKEKIVLRAH
ncbi:MAG: hypothetical protein E7632_11050, partial [Ruminococcaceae bacterium]|nr:hypothetical protein [Oscillospiraceae bacterium]